VLQALDGARVAAPEGAFPLLVVVEAAGVRALRFDLGDDRSGLRRYVDAQFGKPVDELSVDCVVCVQKKATAAITGTVIAARQRGSGAFIRPFCISGVARRRG
jgi:hypothetical protein